MFDLQTVVTKTAKICNFAPLKYQYFLLTIYQQNRLKPCNVLKINKIAVYFINNVVLKKSIFFWLYVVFMLYFCFVKQTKKKVMKKAILIVSIIFLAAWCFFAAATAVPVTAAEITAVCFFELVLLSLPVLAIAVIMNFAE